MNRFKFKDCLDCVHVGNGVNTSNCRSCLLGENFQPRILDTRDEMVLDRDEADSCEMSFEGQHGTG